MGAKPYTKLLNVYRGPDGSLVKVTRKMAIGIFDRDDNLLRLGTYEDYQFYWRDGLTNEEYEARKLLPEVPYSFWIYEPVKEE